MSKTSYTCTGCIPIDKSIVDTYVALLSADKSVEEAEEARVEAEAGRVEAETARVSAEASRVIAEDAREATSSADHAVAVSDHTTAVADHATAEGDHTTATSDHTASVEATEAAGVATTRANEAAAAAEHMVDIKTGPQGPQGNTGSSVDYPYELVNNVTTDDATKGLSAAQGVVLDGKISQLGQELSSIGAFPIIFNIDGGINASDGADAPNYDYKRTNYIPVKQGQVLNYDVSAGSTGWATIACYDSSFAYNFAASVKGASNGTFLIPSGISFVRLSSSKSYANTFGKIQLVSDSVLDIPDGAVSFAKLKKELFAELNRGIGLFLLVGGVSYADGTISLDPNTGRKTTFFIAVKEGERIDYTCYAGSAGWAAVAAYDSSFNYIQSASIAGIPGMVTPNIGTYIVPNGVAYIVMCGLATEENKYAFYNPLTPSQETEIDEKIDEYDGSLPFNVDGGFAYDTGEDANHENFVRTDYISVREGDIITASVQEGSAWWGALALYDSQKNYIQSGSLAGTGSPQSIRITIPNGVSFIRLSSVRNYAYEASKNKVIRENDLSTEDSANRVNCVSFLKYGNILKQRGCIAIQMDLGGLADSYSGWLTMIDTLREYGLMSMDFAINITALADNNIDLLLAKQQEGCEVIYHNRINSPSDFSANSQLTVEEAKEGVCAERLAMTQKGFTTFGVVANNGSIGTQFVPMIDDLFFWNEYGSAQILQNGAENTKAQYLLDQRIIRTGFEIRHSQYTPELEQEMITKGKAWIDSLCANKTMGVMYCHFYNTFVDDYCLYENVLRAMAAYIVEKINDGDLFYGSTTECLNYLCK